MPAIWTFPASCSMVQSASSPLPWLDLSPDWPRLRATLQAGRLVLQPHFAAVVCSLCDATSEVGKWKLH
jgi:hypothetical protein